MDQTDLDDPGNDARASPIIRVIENFLQTMVDRAGEDHAKAVKHGGSLDGGKLKQKPERFIEEYLIKDCISLLGYEDYRPQPRGISGLKDQTPDFRLVDANQLVIGEIKNPNDIQTARKECREYLLDVEQPAAGIATDGFSWYLYLTDRNGTVTRRYTERIRDSVNKLSLEHFYSKGTRRERRALREQISEFSNRFEKSAIESQLEDFLN